MTDRTTRRARGFTLVEMIAVLSLISILAATLIAAIGYASRKAMHARSRATILKLSQGITLFREDYGAYPPEAPTTRNADVFARPNSPYNPNQDDYGLDVRSFGYGTSAQKSAAGAEILYYFLQGRLKEIAAMPNGANKDRALGRMVRKTAYVRFEPAELRDTDRDGRLEVVDPWGKPIMYVAKDQIGNDESGNIEPHVGDPDQPDPTFWPKNAGTFSLYSRGADALADYPEEIAKNCVGNYPANDAHPGKTEAEVNRDNITNWEKE